MPPAGNYYLALLGTPSLTERWELRYGGHHFAFANTYQGGKTAGVTPDFRGAEPMTPVTDHGHTYQPLEQERAAFATLLGSAGAGPPSHHVPRRAAGAGAGRTVPCHPAGHAA